MRFARAPGLVQQVLPVSAAQMDCLSVQTGRKYIENRLSTQNK